MTAAKVVNYTPEQVSELVSAYVAEPTQATVEALASKLGKTARSIVAKLSKEGVYVSKAKEAGKREMLKSAMVAELAVLLGKTEEQLESLEKATGPALMAVLVALRAAYTAEAA
jgi:putative heme iron utilization protein